MVNHHRAPEVAAAHCVSVHTIPGCGSLHQDKPLHYPWYISSFNVSQGNRPRGVWSASGYVISFWVISDTHSCYMHCLGRNLVDRNIEFPLVFIRLQIGTDICARPTADAVATGEVSCCKCIGYPEGFRRRSARVVVK